jgi:excisionase family DNA binding protein
MADESSTSTLLLDIPGVMRELHISRTGAFELIRRGDLPSFKLGRTRRVRRADLIAFVEGLSSGPQSRGLPSPRHEGSPG